MLAVARFFVSTAQHAFEALFLQHSSFQLFISKKSSNLFRNVNRVDA